MHSKNILIVDDDPEDSEFFTMVMEQIHPEIKVSAVTTTEELFHHLEQQTPDLLFIDAFIQHESGLASVAKLKQQDKFQQLPVIMYTGSADMQNVSNAFAAGASAYIVKPHSLAEIKSVLQQTLLQDWGLSIRKQYYLDGEFHDLEQ